MQIFVDADACPVVDIVETIAQKYNISTTLLCDTNHILYSDYSEVVEILYFSAIVSTMPTTGHASASTNICIFSLNPFHISYS